MSGAVVDSFAACIVRMPNVPNCILSILIERLCDFLELRNYDHGVVAFSAYPVGASATRCRPTQEDSSVPMGTPCPRVKLSSITRK